MITEGERPAEAGAVAVPHEKLLTVPEVAERLRVSTDWVTAHAAGRKLPKLPCIRLGKLMRFRGSDIEGFIASQLVAAPPDKRERFRIQ